MQIITLSHIVSMYRLFAVLIVGISLFATTYANESAETIWTVLSDQRKVEDRAHASFATMELQDVKSRLELYRLNKKLAEVSPKELNYIGTLKPPKEYRNVISPERWREMTAETIVVVLFERDCLANAELLTGYIFIDHRGKKRISRGSLTWMVHDAKGNLLYENSFSDFSVQPNKPAKICPFEFNPARAGYLEPPTEIHISVKLEVPEGEFNENCPYTNHYSMPIARVGRGGFEKRGSGNAAKSGSDGDSSGSTALTISTDRGRAMINSPGRGSSSGGGGSFFWGGSSRKK